MVPGCELSETTLNSPGLDKADRIQEVEVVKNAATARLKDMEESIRKLAEIRWTLFPHSSLTEDERDSNLKLSDQLYGEPTYDSYFVRQLLGLRKGGVDFHNESEKYGPTDDCSIETADKNKTYRSAILAVAKDLGFLHDQSNLGPTLTHNGQDLQVALPESGPIGEAKAVIVPGAAHGATGARLCAAVEAIRNGTVSTNHIIMTSCERPTSEPERQKAKSQGFSPRGNNEFEACISLAEDVFGEIEWSESQDRPPYPSDKPTEFREAYVKINGQIVALTILSAPIELGRTTGDGKAANRANTQETFRAAYRIIGGGKLVICSHDTWMPYQGMAALDTFGLERGNEIIAFGPQKTDRITEDDDLLMAEAVVDEIAKTYEYLTNVVVRSENLLSEIEIFERLNQPIPDMDELRQKKLSTDYRNTPIDANHERYSEPIVNLASYGVAGQSYYSRDNATTGTAVDGVPKEIHARQSVAKVLAAINRHLEHPAIAKFFGGPVELYVEEGVRRPEIQKQLYDDWMPNSIRQQNPDWTDDQVAERRDQLVAKPPKPGNPSPHMTGGAIDLRLRYRRPLDSGGWSPDFTPDSFVNMGHVDGSTGDRNNPDFFENNDSNPEAKKFRRAFYAIMTGQAFGTETGLVVNPTEWWHWGTGDQLSAFLKDESAYYNEPSIKH